LLYERRDRETKASLNRSLPLIESVSDRWERASAQGWGPGTSIYHLSYVFGDVQVGEHTWIGPYTLLDGSGRLTIGSWCSISSGVQIYTHNTVNWAVSGGAAEYEHSPTTIGDRCFIGPLAVVAMGVTIGPRCVVGAHSFVNRDLPEGSVAVGVPARPVGRVLVDDGGNVHVVYD
jgi:acetyltransferase-like isoleucine patch superfamily enzyme